MLCFSGNSELWNSSISIVNELRAVYLCVSSPVNFLADSSVCVDSSTVESVVLHMADPFISITWEILRVWREERVCLTFPVESF